MAKAAKLIAMKRGKVLLVRRRVDGLWMFPGGRRRPGEDDKECLRREIVKELPKLKLGRLVLWREATTKNKYSGRRMSDALFIAKKRPDAWRSATRRAGRGGLVQASSRPADAHLALHSRQAVHMMGSPRSVKLRKQSTISRLGVISDTHGLLRPEAERSLAGVDHIIHAGDIGHKDIVLALARIAPVTAIRGNVDKAAWAQAYPKHKALASRSGPSSCCTISRRWLRSPRAVTS